MLRSAALAMGLAAALLSAGVAPAEVRQIEAEGVVPLAPGVSHDVPPRDEAVRRALSEAVRRVAIDLVPEMTPEEAGDFLPEVLGDEPLIYTTRFRIIEDRGDRPAILSEDPTAQFEYVVLVEAHIDSDRVEARLAEAGLLAARAPGPAVRELTLVVEAAGSFAAYAALRRTLLDDLGVDSAVPVELERGRAVVRVIAAAGPRQLLEQILQAAPPELVVTPIEVGEGFVTLRVDLDSSLAESAPPSSRAELLGPASRD